MGRKWGEDAYDAREMFASALRLIEADWLAYRRALWQSLVSAEHRANQFMMAHLLQSEERVAETVDQYVGLPGLLYDNSDRWSEAEARSLVGLLLTRAKVRGLDAGDMMLS